jgi:hypothetical protein
MTAIKNGVPSSLQIRHAAKPAAPGQNACLLDID